MEFLLDLIFSNLPVILIVIGVVSSFMGKWKKNSAEEDGKRKPIPEVFKEAVGEHYPEKKAAKKKPQNRQQQSGQQGLNLPNAIQGKEKMGDMEAKLKEARDDFGEILPSYRKSPVINHKSIADTEISDYKPELSFDREKLIDGMIMAEVLGPPRSRMNKRRR